VTRKKGQTDTQPDDRSAAPQEGSLLAAQRGRCRSSTRCSRRHPCSDRQRSAHSTAQPPTCMPEKGVFSRTCDFSPGKTRIQSQNRAAGKGVPGVPSPNLAQRGPVEAGSHPVGICSTPGDADPAAPSGKQVLDHPQGKKHVLVPIQKCFVFQLVPVASSPSSSHFRAASGSGSFATSHCPLAGSDRPPSSRCTAVSFGAAGKPRSPSRSRAPASATGGLRPPAARSQAQPLPPPFRPGPVQRAACGLKIPTAQLNSYKM